MINLINMYQWDNTLFDDITLPSPIDAMVPDIANMILLQCGRMTPIFPEPDIFKMVMTRWFTTWGPNFKHMWDTTQYEYNPIENYNRFTNGSEESSDTTSENIDETQNFTADDTTTNTGSDSDVGSGTDTTENTISAMNSSSYQPDTKSEVTLGSTMTHNVNNKSVYDGNDKTVRDYGRKYDRDYDRGYGEHVHGNIGVTTTQQMIEEERRIAMFNLQQFIVDKFRDELMLRVYTWDYYN